MKGKIEIDIIKLKESGLHIEAYAILYLKFVGDLDGLNIIAEHNMMMISYLESTDWVKVTGGIGVNFELRAKAIELFTPSTTAEKVEDVDEWFQELRDIFKATKKVGAMGDANAVKDKLKRFRRKNPKYTKQQILNAAKAYVQSCAKDGYRFLQQADYFIEKQDTSKIGRSRLSIFLEELEGKPITTGGTGILPLDEGCDYVTTG